uniref:Uncharacterized LOC110951236 n=1 Tax=Acanthochromis polyacanthus TaxID=80966 RepID=A0A3Q1G6K6_9TELE
MSRCLPVLLLVALACLARLGSARLRPSTPRQRFDGKKHMEDCFLSCSDTPKVAFAASLGGNGLVKTTNGNKDLLYKDVLTNVGGAYNKETGEFTAPIRGVYYIRFTANAPTDFTMSAVLYKNDAEIQLIAHEQPSGAGSDTASNGGAFLLEKGDKLKMVLWHNTQIWDNSNHHSTFSGFLLFPM